VSNDGGGSALRIKRGFQRRYFLTQIGRKDTCHHSGGQSIQAGAGLLVIRNARKPRATLCHHHYLHLHHPCPRMGSIPLLCDWDVSKATVAMGDSAS